MKRRTFGGRCWGGLPRAWSLEADECHVWRATLAADAKELGRLQELLGQSERQRAGQFRFEKDRRAYILCHGILRSLLGRYLEVEPNKLSFSSNARGKPHLSQPLDNLHLRYNLSRSNGVALFAFARYREVGVDIELLRSIPDWESIAQQMLTPQERAALYLLPAEDRLAGFFNSWTRKEAILKATGEGIVGGMERVEVTLTPGEPARLLHIDGQASVGCQWTLHHLDPAPNFVAAVAVKGPSVRFVCRSWEEQFNFS